MAPDVFDALARVAVDLRAAPGGTVAVEPRVVHAVLDEACAGDRRKRSEYRSNGAQAQAASLWLSPFVAPLLYGVDPRDPLTMLVAAAMLAATGLVAAWIPASRAAAVDPAAALRAL